VRRHRDVVVADAREGAVDAVELLADVLADDAGLRVEPVPLGAVGGPVGLEQGVADDRADDQEAIAGDPLDQEGRAGRRRHRRAARRLDPRVGEGASARARH
jgi:hypothetical protein